MRSEGGFWESVCADFLHHAYPLKRPERFGHLKKIVLAWLSVEFRVVLSFRIQSFLYRRGAGRLAHLLYLRAKRKYHCDIHPCADIAPGLRVAHCSDIVIGPEVSIGRHAVIFNGVTLGNRDLEDTRFRMPRVGDHVIIGTGSKLIGGITIGDRVIVGANAVVNRDVPSSVVVAGIPARVIRSRDSRPGSGPEVPNHSGGYD